MGLCRIASRGLIAGADSLYNPSMLGAYSFNPRLIVQCRGPQQHERIVETPG